jgi:hypothetical protein
VAGGSGLVGLSSSTKVPIAEFWVHPLQGEVSMGTFSVMEIAHLRGQLLGRLATAGADCGPHVVPVNFGMSEETRSSRSGARA